MRIRRYIIGDPKMEDVDVIAIEKAKLRETSHFLKAFHPIKA